MQTWLCAVMISMAPGSPRHAVSPPADGTPHVVRRLLSPPLEQLGGHRVSLRCDPGMAFQEDDPPSGWGGRVHLFYVARTRRHGKQATAARAECLVGFLTEERYRMSGPAWSRHVQVRLAGGASGLIAEDRIHTVRSDQYYLRLYSRHKLSGKWVWVSCSVPYDERSRWRTPLRRMLRTLQII